MANLRVVFDNAIHRAATLTATQNVAGLPISNVLTDYKSEIWRSIAVTSVSITMTWPDPPETIGCVVLAHTNLTSTALVNVALYDQTADGVPDQQSGYQNAAAGVNFGDFVWGSQPLGVNSYAYGGASYAVIYVPRFAARKVTITITDTLNPAGYLEVGRIIVGDYWEPTYNAEAGVTLGVADLSKNERTDAGDLRTDRGTQHKTLSLDLNYLTQADKNTFYGIMRNGIYRPLFVSVTPESPDDIFGEQMYQLYGKMSKATSLKYQLLGQFSTQLELEEI